MEGNYNENLVVETVSSIIPLREMEGNYNRLDDDDIKAINYTLERDGRELQLYFCNYHIKTNYTLERDGRELQRTTVHRNAN